LHVTEFCCFTKTCVANGLVDRHSCCFENEVSSGALIGEGIMAWLAVDWATEGVGGIRSFGTPYRLSEAFRILI
jgi:hypothetical protein